ncbi:T9SS type A sorting domain-containing protein [Falsiporphyromonas endometrii]|uniref:T9SS type A sorting domain-containing protein n=1 Tax=Falsiporphyromonas endometrii TaxID=1387297 RepID=A0ABV9K6V0_9PORP
MRHSYKLLISFASALTLCSNATTAYGQQSFGGQPLSLKFGNTLRSAQTADVRSFAVRTNLDDFLSRQDWLTRTQASPFALGVVTHADLDFASEAKKIKLENGQTVYRLLIRSEGAKEIGLTYSDFYLPQGSRLFIYSPSGEIVHGAYTTATHSEGGSFSTTPILGDQLVLEYEPNAKGELPSLHINGIMHFARSGYSYSDAEDASQFAKEININCPQGDDWQDQKAGVCKMVIVDKDGTIFSCSGDLLNNTAKDFSPIIISAAHCSGLRDYFEPTDDLLDQWQFYFHFEKPGCANSGTSNDALVKTMVGCRKLAFTPIDGDSDGLLLKLNKEIPASYRVFYNGWDRRSHSDKDNQVDLKGVVGIHHPAGDVKKISILHADDEEGIVPAVWTNPLGTQDAHFTFSFNEGDTEGGSSGSSLFSQENKLVVGTLTGGGDGQQFYGRLSYHWDHFEEKFGDFLDPVGKRQAETLEGTYRGQFRPVYPVTELYALPGSNESEFKIFWKPAKNTDFALKTLGKDNVKYTIIRNGKEIATVDGTRENYTDNTAKLSELGARSADYQIRVSYHFPEDQGGVVSYLSDHAMAMQPRKVKPFAPDQVKKDGNATLVSWHTPEFVQEWSKLGLDASNSKMQTFEMAEAIMWPFNNRPFGGDLQEGQRKQQDKTIYVERWNMGATFKEIDGKVAEPLFLKQISFIPDKTQVGKKMWIRAAYEYILRQKGGVSDVVMQEFAVSENEVGNWKTVVLDKPLRLDPDNTLIVGFAALNTARPSLTYFEGSQNSLSNRQSAHMLLTDFKMLDSDYDKGEYIEELQNMRDPYKEGSKTPTVNGCYMAMKLFVANSPRKFETPVYETEYVGRSLAPSPIIEGYNVKKDGHLLATVGAEQLSYKDEENTEGKGNYEIEPIYDANTMDAGIIEKTNRASLYPSIIDDYTYFRGKEDASSINIYNLNGQVVKKLNHVCPGQKIVLDNLTPATYVVIIDINGQNIEQKIIKK